MDPSRLPRGLWSVLRETLLRWIRHRAPSQAAAIAFYSLISLTPVLVLLLEGADTLFADARARHEIVEQVGLYMGAEAAEVVEEVAAQVADEEANPLSGVLGLGILLFGATAVFANLQDALNTVWEVEGEGGRMIWALVRKRLLSFVMVVVMGVLLLVSLVLGTILSAVAETLEWRFQVPAGALVLVDNLISFALVTLLFAAIFQVLPDADLRLRHVAAGAIVTSLLFALGRFVIGTYLGRAGVGSAYGAAGSLVVFLFWIYYSTAILLFGAELTRVSSRRLRRGVSPSEGARRRPERPAEDTGEVPA